MPYRLKFEGIEAKIEDSILMEMEIEALKFISENYIIPRVHELFHDFYTLHTINHINHPCVSHPWPGIESGIISAISKFLFSNYRDNYYSLMGEFRLDLNLRVTDFWIEPNHSNRPGTLIDPQKPNKYETKLRTLTEFVESIPSELRDKKNDNA